LLVLGAELKVSLATQVLYHLAILPVFFMLVIFEIGSIFGLGWPGLRSSYLCFPE
jgi:hypothetical protein